MAVDKLVDSTQLNSDLTSVANAIRTKGGTSASLAFPSGFVSAIQNIPSGGGGLPETLLGSGTFTVAAVASQYVVPVTYTGTPNELLVTKDNEDVGIGETTAWINITPDLPTAVAAFPIGVRLERLKTDTDAVSYMSNFSNNAQIVHFSDSNGVYNPTGSYITIRQYGNNNKIQTGDYHWYIYGSAS